MTPALLTPHGTVDGKALAAIGVANDDRFAIALQRTSPNGKWHLAHGGCDGGTRATAGRVRPGPLRTIPGATHTAVGFDLDTVCRNCGSPVSALAGHVLAAAAAVQGFADWGTAWALPEGAEVSWLDHARVLASIPDVARLDQDLAAPLRNQREWADAVTGLDRARTRLHRKAEKVLAAYAATAPRRHVDAALDQAVTAVAPAAIPDSDRVARIQAPTPGAPWQVAAFGQPARTTPSLWEIVHQTWTRYRREHPDTSGAADALRVAITHAERHLPPTLPVHNLAALPDIDPTDGPRPGERVHDWAARTFTTYRRALVIHWVRHLDTELDGLVAGVGSETEPLTHAVMLAHWPPITDADTDRAHLSAYPVLARLRLDDPHGRSTRNANAGPHRHVSAPESVVAIAVPAWQAEALAQYRQAPLPTALPASTPTCHDKTTATHTRAVHAAQDLFHACGFNLIPADATSMAATITTAPLTVRRERDSHSLDQVPDYDLDRQRPLRPDATPRQYTAQTRERPWDDYTAREVLDPGARFIPGTDRLDLLALAASWNPIPVNVTLVTAPDGPLVTVTGHITAADPNHDTLDLRPHRHADPVRVPVNAVAAITVARTDRYGDIAG